MVTSTYTIIMLHKTRVLSSPPMSRLLQQTAHFFLYLSRKYSTGKKL